MHSHDDISRFVDKLDVKRAETPVTGEKKKVRGFGIKKRHLMYLICFCASMLLGVVVVAMFVFPVFNRETLGSENDVLKKLGEDIPEPYIVEHFIPPENSFGIGETNFTYVNWSFFWQKFRSNSRWDMEGWHPIQEEWVSEYQGTDLDDWLNISRIRSSDNSSEKITLNFTSPYTTKYRFTFGIDAKVLSFVNKTDRLEYVLTYPINNSEYNYTVYFNWSDLIPMLDNGTISVNHGIKNVGGRDVFWFRIITNVDLQEGISYLLDPTFGNTHAGSSSKNIGSYMYASKFTAPEDGTIYNMSWYLQQTVELKVMLYDSSTKNLLATGTGMCGSGWNTIEFDTPYEMSNGEDFYFAGRGDRACLCYYDSVGGWPYWYDGGSYSSEPQNPATPSTGTGRKFSVYVTYNVGGGETSWNNVINTINGSWSNTTSWVTTINTINGSYSNITSWVNTSSINGSYSAVTIFNVITNTINGSYSNTSSEITWNNVINTINGSWSNSTFFKVVNNEINGSYSNSSSWNDLADNINGSYSNATSFIVVSNTINGSYSNFTSWVNTINTINGSWSNISHWNNVVDTINGSYSNSSVFNVVTNTINGSYSNFTQWIIQIDTINGSWSNTTSWNNIVNDVNGSYSNSTSWINISSINGSYSNDTIIWSVINNSVNGSYSNTSKVFPLNITLVFPTNNSVITNLQPTLIFMINNSGSGQMNYSIYIGDNLTTINTFLDNDSGLDNATIYYDYNDATDYENYYLRIYLNCSNEHLNTSFTFRLSKGLGRMVDTPGYELMSLICAVFVAIFLLKKKRRY